MNARLLSVRPVWYDGTAWQTNKMLYAHVKELDEGRIIYREIVYDESGGIMVI